MIRFVWCRLTNTEINVTLSSAQNKLRSRVSALRGWGWAMTAWQKRQRVTKGIVGSYQPVRAGTEALLLPAHIYIYAARSCNDITHQVQRWWTWRLDGDHGNIAAPRSECSMGWMIQSLTQRSEWGEVRSYAVKAMDSVDLHGLMMAKALTHWEWEGWRKWLH